MKNTFKSLAIAMALLSMAACQKENFKEAEPVQGNAKTFICNFDTKAVAANGVQTFAVGEKIDLINNEAKERVTVTLTEEMISNGGKTVHFSADYPADKSVLAVYPAGNAPSWKQGQTELDKPHISGLLNSRFDGLATAVAGPAEEGQNRTLTFNNVACCISFSSSESFSATNKWATIWRNDGAKLASNIEFDPETGAATAYEAAGMMDYAFTQFNNVGQQTNDIRLWVLPQTFEGGFTLKVGTATTAPVKTVTVSKDFTISAGQFIRLGDIDVETPVLSASQISASGHTATINWSYRGEEDLTKDYKVWLYDDEECESLHFAMSIPASAGVFKKGYGTNFIFSGLTPSTTYYAKVTDGENETPVIPVTTTEAFGYKTVPATEAVAGDVILKEDFSELIYSGDVIDYAAGYVPSAVLTADNKAFDLFDAFVPATGDEPEGFSPAAYGKTMYLGIAASKAIATTRIKDWATIATIKMHRAHSICGMVNLGDSSYDTALATPELSCLKAEGTLAKLELKFKATTWSASAGTAMEIGIVDPGATIAPRADGSSDMRLTGTYTAVTTIDAKYGWDEYTVTVDNVLKGSRLYIGNSNKSRFLVKDVQVTLVEYKEKTGVSKVEVNVGGTKTTLTKNDKIFEGEVDIPAEGSFTVELDGAAYGFLTQSGAGGLGTCTNTMCAVPVEAAKWSNIPLNVRKAKGSLALSTEGGNDFWTKIPAAGKMNVVIDTEPVTPTYNIRLVEAVNPDLYIDETFDLLLGGGDYLRANKTNNAASGPYGVWLFDSSSDYTTPAYNGAKWYGDKSATLKIPYDMIEGLEIEEWIGTETSYFDFQFQCLHIGGSKNVNCEVYSPYFKGIDGEENVVVTLDMLRFAAGTTCDFTLEIDGPGIITEGKTVVDYVNFGEGPKTQNWIVDAADEATSYVLKDNEYFSHPIDWGNHPDSPKTPSANNTKDKPLSHMIFTIEGATAATRLHITSGTETGRLQIHGLRVELEN